MEEISIFDSNHVAKVINEKYGIIDTEELRKSIKKYRKIDLRHAKDDVVLNCLKEIISVRFNMVYGYNSTTELYRIRKLSKKDGNRLTKRTDLLYPPSDVVKHMGRLNNAHEPLLYTGLSPRCLMDEVKVDVDEYYTLIKYKIKEGEILNVSSVGLYEEDHIGNIGNEIYFSELRGNLTKEAKINFDIIEDFLNNEFTKDVGLGTEFLYRTSNLISKYLCHYTKVDGFLYPSVGAKQGYNVALKPDAVDRAIDIVGLQIFKLVSYPEDGMIVTTALAGLWSDEIVDSEIIYRHPDEKRTFSFRDQLY